jgi:hypothetical protein
MKASSRSTWENLLSARAAGGTATWHVLPGVNEVRRSRPMPAPDSWSALPPPGQVLLAGFRVSYIRACTCYVFDEPLDGAGADTSPTFNPG